MCSKKVLNNIFVCYIHQVIKNTALAYYRKKFLYKNRNLLCTDFQDLVYPHFDNAFVLDYLTIKNVNQLEFYTDNPELSFALSQLSLKEKQFIFNKYILSKTDKEISIELGITRQGVSILKKRMLEKLEYCLKSTR
ncbi:TPA: sigma-70 family RNA polymerase sigma factor [Enterococcus faecalis]